MTSIKTLSGLPKIAPGTSPEEIFRIGRQIVTGPIALACSFSVDDVVLIDLLRNSFGDFRVFAIDTGRLNEETYETAERVTKRYGLKIDWYFPAGEAVEHLEREKGLFSFHESLENRKECCFIRKVEPLQRALLNAAGWVTGMRREQSFTREGLEPLEIDSINSGRLKINPLAFWTTRQLMDYSRQHRVPINRLHQKGYPSIGCAPCTRAVRPGEHPRAGRWWWEDPEHRECGLHRR